MICIFRRYICCALLLQSTITIIPLLQQLRIDKYLDRNPFHMMKLKLTLIIVLNGFLASAQHNFIFQSDYYTSISKVVNDDLGNIYAIGTYKGNCSFGSVQKSSRIGNKFVAKVGSDGNVQWIHDYPDYIWDAVVMDSVIRVLHKERIKDPMNRAENLLLYIEDLDLNTGKALKKFKVAELDGEYFQISLRGYFGADGSLATAATWKRNKITSWNGQTLSKNHYSGGLISYFDPNGKEIWNYTFSGGIDGFTNINMQAIHVGENGHVYAAAQYGKEIQFGDVMLTTAVSAEEKGYKTLYNDAVILLDLHEGNLMHHARVGDYDFKAEHIETDSIGNVYLAGDFSGNESFEDSGIEKGFYKNALFNGEKLPSTPINSGTNQPSQSTFIASLSPALKTRWIKTYTGQAHVGPRSLSVKNGVYLTAMYMHTIDIDNSVVKAHPENDGKYDCALIEYDLNGNMQDVQHFSGADNDWIYVLATESMPILFGIVHDKVEMRGTEVTAGDSKHGVGFINSNIKPQG